MKALAGQWTFRHGRRSVRLAHDGGPELAAQIAGLRVSETSGGLSVSTRSGRSDLARAVAWAVADAVKAPQQALPFFVY
jgi:hypothetical protein